MAKFSNELKIGLVVLFAIFIGYMGFRIMKDEPIFSQVNVLYTKFDTVEGLIRGSNVYLNGFKIGTVREMQYLVQEDSALITLNITEDIQLPKGSMAQLASPDFLGSSTIRIIKSNSSESLEWGSYLKGIQKEGLLNTFTDRGTAISDSVAVTITLLNEKLRALDFLNQQSSNDIGSALSNVKQTSDYLLEAVTSNSDELTDMIGSAKRSLETIKDISDSSRASIEQSIKNLELLSVEMSQLTRELSATSTTLNSVLEKMDRGEGSLGLLLNDPSLYENVDSLSYNLNELIKGIKEDPKRYLKHLRLLELF
ncbi:MAG: MlaD family protein [Bacteroidetes bacterium]|nr:MlaD family protein [Bacteroidota bacterium]